jgi:hypothetical protein
MHSLGSISAIATEKNITLGFLFRYEIQNGGYGRTKFNFGPYGKKISKRFCPAVVAILDFQSA